MEVKRAPAGPAADAVRVVTPIVLARVMRQTHGGHALQQRHAHATHRDFIQVVVPHIVQHQHHAATGQATQVGVALQQNGVCAITGGRQCRGKPGRATTHDDDIRLGSHAHARCGALDHITDIVHKVIPFRV